VIQIIFSLSQIGLSMREHLGTINVQVVCEHHARDLADVDPRAEDTPRLPDACQVYLTRVNFASSRTHYTLSVWNSS
jgi:hypothetical protein